MPDASSCSPSGIPTDNCSALAGTLEAAADALLAVCRSLGSGSGPEAGTRAHISPASAPAAPPGEYRCYHLPPHAVREEKVLLQYYGAENFASALNAIHSELYITIFLMQRYDSIEDVDSFHIHLLGEHLSRSLQMLGKACSMFADFTPVQTAPGP